MLLVSYLGLRTAVRPLTDFIERAHMERLVACSVTTRLSTPGSTRYTRAVRRSSSAACLVNVPVAFVSFVACVHCVPREPEELVTFRLRIATQELDKGLGRSTAVQLRKALKVVAEKRMGRTWTARIEAVQGAAAAEGGRYLEARKMLTSALQTLERINEPPTLSTALAHLYLAQLVDDAKTRLMHALEAERLVDVLPKRATRLRTDTGRMLAEAYAGIGDQDMAERIYLKKLQDNIAAFGERSEPVARDRVWLGAFYRNCGRYDEAVSHFEAVVQADHIANAVNGALFAEMFGEIAKTRCMQGRRKAALVYIEKIKAITAYAAGRSVYDSLRDAQLACSID